MVGENALGKSNVLAIRDAIREHNKNNPDKIVTNMSMLKLATMIGTDEVLKELDECSEEFYTDVTRFLV